MNDDLTTMLSRQLHEQVDGWHATPLTLDGVQGRARSIRRTRRVVAVGAVAAVLAVAVPVAITAGGGLDASPDRDLPPATTSPSQGVDTAEPDGSGPAIPYLEGRTLTMPDGSTTGLPRRYERFTLLGDLVLATWTDTETGDRTLERLLDGEEVGTEAITGITANHEGDAVAYVPADGQVIVEWAGGDTTLETVPGARPVRLLGGPGCSDEECVVYYEDGQTVRFVDGSGNAGTVEGLAVSDVSAEGEVAVLTRVDDLEPGSCSEVRAVDRVVFSTCDYSLDRFSPDGAHLSANEDYLDGIGARFVAILDAETGEEVVRVEPAEGFVGSVVWEDADHLLAVIHDWSDGTWTVERLGVDATTETVLGPVAGGEMNPPWRLQGTD